MKKATKPVIFIVIGIVFLISICIFNFKNHYTSHQGGASFDEKLNEVNTDNGSSFDFSNFKGNFTLMEFTTTKGSKIEISDTSIISKGTLDIVVSDSHYKDVIVHNSTKESSFDFTAPKDGMYFIRLVGKNAYGTLDLKINSDTNIDLIHKDIYDD